MFAKTVFSCSLFSGAIFVCPISLFGRRIGETSPNRRKNKPNRRIIRPNDPLGNVGKDGLKAWALLQVRRIGESSLLRRIGESQTRRIGEYQAE